MIRYISGKVLALENASIIVLNQGIGYQVLVGPRTLSVAKIGGEIELYTFHNIKEDTSDLFGFDSLEELHFFEKLLTVSGVGPKTALTVLSGMSVSDLEDALVRDDASALTKISGVGRKIAERIVLELREKVGGIRGITSSAPSVDVQVIEALENLGYSAYDARNALKNLEGTFEGVDDKLKAVLQQIGSRK